METKIIQITTDVTGSNEEIDSGVYGLGEDNKIYYWNSKTAEWKLWKRE
jgi:hypothetical protein